MVLEAFASVGTCTGLKKGVRMKRVLVAGSQLSGDWEWCRCVESGHLPVPLCGTLSTQKCELVPRANALDAEIRGCELLN